MIAGVHSTVKLLATQYPTAGPGAPVESSAYSQPCFRQPPTPITEECTYGSSFICNIGTKCTACYTIACTGKTTLNRNKDPDPAAQPIGGAVIVRRVIIAVVRSLVLVRIVRIVLIFLLVLAAYGG